MIPTKLYIPTSTLNFNNIMSSESISPASFYPNRGFGFKRFVKVEPNNLDNRIILYEYFPSFNIIDKELENFPLIIEIDTNSISEDIIQEQNGSFFTEETIYFNPFTTKFYFREEREKNSTLSISEPSIETKMVPLYENCFQIKSQDTSSNNWIKAEIEDSKNDISKHISKDRRTNKLKGFLYAYLLGANKSVSDDLASLRKQVKNLKNTLSAIVTNLDRKTTYQQEEQLKALYSQINSKFVNVYLDPIFKERSEKYQCDFYGILKQENLLDSWLRQNNYLKYQIPTFRIPEKERVKSFDSYLHNLDYQVATLENRQQKSQINISKLPSVQNFRIIDIEQKEFLTKLFNQYLEELYNSEEFIQSRYEFAKSGGKIFKEELQDKWEGSQSQFYINALLKNLNEYSSFDIKSIKNFTLQSFAAFCQKGEPDIDKLEDYLISNEIGDFHIAFGLWGIIFGFASMPKTLTDDLFSIDDLSYTSTAYKYIFKQVHGIDLEGNIENRKDKITIERHPYKNESNNILMQEEALNDKYTQDQDIRIKLKKCKLKSDQLDFICEIYNKNNKLLNPAFFNNVKKVLNIRDKKIIKIQDALGYKEVIPEADLFSPKSQTVEFYNHPSAFYLLEALIAPVHKKKFKIDLDWFQDEYRKGQSSQYYAKRNRDNQAVIESFRRYIEKKEYASQIDIDAMIDLLIKFYVINER